MNISEAITALRSGHRVTKDGHEVILVSGRLRIQDDTQWYDIPVTEEILNANYRIKTSLVEYSIYTDRGIYKYTVGLDNFDAINAPSRDDFRGYRFSDGHIGANLHCIKNRNHYVADFVILERTPDA